MNLEVMALWAFPVRVARLAQVVLRSYRARTTNSSSVTTYSVATAVVHRPYPSEAFRRVLNYCSVGDHAYRDRTCPLPWDPFRGREVDSFEDSSDPYLEGLAASDPYYLASLVVRGDH